MLPTTSSDTSYTRVVDEGVAAPSVRTARLARTLGLVSVALAAGIAGVTLWYSSSSQSAKEEITTAAVVFPEPTSLEHANELLLNLPPMDPEKLYEMHVSPHIATMYKQFLVHFGSTASGDTVHNLSSRDFSQRLPIFEHNVKEIIQLNGKWHKSHMEMDSAMFEINLYADWSQDESKRLAGFKPEEGEHELATFLGPAGAKANLSAPLAIADSIDESDVIVPELFYAAWPSSSIRRRVSWNWASYYPTVFKVRNQGPCGSCWAHTVAEDIRQVYAAKHGTDVGVLSVQYIVDCVRRTRCADGANGCCGGDVMSGFRYINKHGGIPLRSTYGAYHGSSPKISHKCRQGMGKMMSSGRYLRSESEMARALWNEGPVAVGLQINSAFMKYGGGVLLKHQCLGHPMGGHAVMVVGYDNSKSAWIIQNSWGEGWGVTRDAPYNIGTRRRVSRRRRGGFILLHYGGHVCGLTSHYGSTSIATNIKDVSRRRVSRRRAALKGHGER